MELGHVERCSGLVGQLNQVDLGSPVVDKGPLVSFGCRYLTPLFLSMIALNVYGPSLTCDALVLGQFSLAVSMC